MGQIAVLKGESVRQEPFVENYLLYLLAASSHALSREFHALVKSQGLRVNEWRVLACLADQPGMMLTELADKVLFEQSHMTKVIDRMTEQGLVSRTKPDHDRRKVTVQITQKGQELIEPLIATARGHERECLKHVSTADIATLKRVLKQLTFNSMPRLG